MNIGNLKFIKVKISQNFDAKKLVRIDKMSNVGNPEVRKSEKVMIKCHFWQIYWYISSEKLGPKSSSSLNKS